MKAPLTHPALEADQQDFTRLSREALQAEGWWEAIPEQRIWQHPNQGSIEIDTTAGRIFYNGPGGIYTFPPAVEITVLIVVINRAVAA